MAFGVVGPEGGNRNEDKRRNLIRRLLRVSRKKKVDYPSTCIVVFGS